MNNQLDATIVAAWTELTSLRERGPTEVIDDKCQSIIYAVAAAETRGEPINQNGLLRALKPKSNMPILSRTNALIRTGWLKVEKNEADRRNKYLRLTPKSIAMVNALSRTLKSVVNRANAMSAAVLALLWDYENSSANVLATGLLAI